MHKNETKALRVVTPRPDAPRVDVKITATNGDRSVEYRASFIDEISDVEAEALDQLIARARRGRRIIDYRP